MRTRILKPFALASLLALSSCSVQSGTDLTKSQTATQTSAMAQPSFHTKGSPTGKPTGPLKPGEYWWNPQMSPAGPVVVLVSLPLQTISVYRNGILIGRSSVSTGSKGHETPSGVFTILEKKQTHYSSTYDDAPMPNMQRLTWQGIAMHSGNLPGYAASHGCIRMPYDFSTLLYSITARGATVVIGNSKNQPHFAANPGLMLAPKDFNSGMLKPLAKGEYDWNPKRSTKGPITIMVSSADQSIYVYRNGQPIGRASVQVKGRLGDHVFTLLDGVSGGSSPFAPGRAARRWMSVSGGSGSPHELASKVSFSPEFAQKVDDLLSPGATIVVTDRPATRSANELNILTN
ncbi:L,D-transpeptidase [Luteolibacter luteus]|uniref:L,D-transpeptidase n=1 Tax=Luteolibacter luteus TaxID=2728835 RepID=A0A858RFJ9_9BACT|nr:L,D-transpeptidase [Luteolibacter luteus]QJE94913.1 L,D-transpeptidase [Luteolibacter luteus]